MPHAGPSCTYILYSTLSFIQWIVYPVDSIIHPSNYLNLVHKFTNRACLSVKFSCHVSVLALSMNTFKPFATLCGCHVQCPFPESSL